jgi:hypothetical protein
VAIALRHAGTFTGGLTASGAIAIDASQLTGDMMIALGMGKPFNAAMSISGWTLLGSGSSGTTAAGIDTGSMKISAWYKEAVSDTETNPTLTEGTPAWNVVQGIVMVFSKGASEAWSTPVAVFGADEVTGTAISITLASDPGGAAGDYLAMGVAINSDTMGPLTADLTLAWTGITLGAYNTAVEGETTTGGDMAAQVRSVPVSSGTSSAAPVMSGTGTGTGGADRAEGIVIRLRVTAATTRAYDQVAYRGRNDDGNETTATWKAAENTGWDQVPDANFRFRAVIDETAGGTLDAVLDFKLQYNKGGAGWNDVNTTSAVVKIVLSGNVTNGEATTDQLAGGTGTFLAGSIDESNGAASTPNNLDNGEYTELEWVLQVVGADVVDNDTIQLRVVQTAGSIVLGTYSQTPTITVDESLPANRIEVSFAELETPNPPNNRVEVSWAEIEVPNAPQRVEVSWAELEVPLAPARVEISWAEFETPNFGSPDNRVEVAWAELEVPFAPARVEISWAELEVPNQPNGRVEVSWVELEVPNIPSGRVDISFAEFQVDGAPARVEVSWAEFQTPDEGGGEPSDFEWIMDWIDDELVCQNRTHDHYPHYPKRSNEDDRIYEPSRPGEL